MNNESLGLKMASTLFKMDIGVCRMIKTKGMVFRYTWVYSKEDTMAHTYRPMFTS